MSIPDFMPVLSAGGHTDPSKGACVMEYISLLAGEAWSDEPACTHPMLSAIARAVNDQMCGEHRPLLIPLIPRLMGTDHLTRRSEQDLYDWVRMDGRSGGPGGAPYVFVVVQHAMRGGEPGHAYNCQEGVALLTRTLDKYDQITGRTEVTPLTEEALRFMSEVVAQ